MRLVLEDGGVKMRIRAKLKLGIFNTSLVKSVHASEILLQLSKQIYVYSVAYI